MDKFKRQQQKTDAEKKTKQTSAGFLSLIGSVQFMAKEPAVCVAVEGINQSHSAINIWFSVSQKTYSLGSCLSLLKDG